MNQEQFLAVYNKKRPGLPFLEDFCRKYPNLMSSGMSKPELFNPRPSSVKIKRAHPSLEENSSITNTISICSNLSRVGIDKFVIQNILGQRKEHPIFTELEMGENCEAKQWYFIEDKDEKILGPFTNTEMDQRFELGVLKEKTKIKKKFEENYSPLMVLVKRYYKNVLSDRIDFEKKDPNKLSNKFIKFHKGEAIKGNLKVKEKYDPRQREERFFSEAIRPKLVDLNHMLPKMEGEEEGSDIYSRMRANTMHQQ